MQVCTFRLCTPLTQHVLHTLINVMLQNIHIDEMRLYLETQSIHIENRIANLPNSVKLLSLYIRLVSFIHYTTDDFTSSLPICVGIKSL